MRELAPTSLDLGGGVLEVVAAEHAHLGAIRTVSREHALEVRPQAVIDFVRDDTHRALAQLAATPAIERSGRE